MFDEDTRYNIADFSFSGKPNLINDGPSNWKSTNENLIKLVDFDPHTQKCYLSEYGNVSTIPKLDTPSEEYTPKQLEDEPDVGAVKDAIAFLMVQFYNVIRVDDLAAFEEKMNMGVNDRWVNLHKRIQKVKDDSGYYAN